MVKRASFLPPPDTSHCSFFSFFLPTTSLPLSTCFFSPSLSLPLFPPLRLLLFHFPPGRERGRLREITRPPWAPAQPSRAQCSLLSQFANRAPDPRIVHLHFTIFRSEINTAPSAPHHDAPPSRGPSRSPCAQDADLPRLAPTSFWAAARPTDPENRRRPCEMSRGMEIDRPSTDRSRRRWLVIKKA